MHRGGAAGAWHRGAAEGLNVVRAEAVVNADVWGIAAECGGGLLVGDQQVGVAEKANIAEAGVGQRFSAGRLPGFCLTGESGHPFCSAAGGGIDGWIGPHMNAEVEAGEGQQVAGQQRPANDSLPVNPRPIRTAKVSQIHQTVSFYQHTVLLGDAGVIQHQITLLSIAADDGNRVRQGDGRTTVFGNQLSQHGVVPQRRQFSHRIRLI